MGAIWPKEGTVPLYEALDDLSQMPLQEECTLSLGHMTPSLWIVPLRRTPVAHGADRDCADARVTVYAGMFHGDYLARLSSCELNQFRNAVDELLNGRHRRLKFCSAEGSVEVELAQRTPTEYTARCVVRDGLRWRSELRFEIPTDRIDIENLRDRLDGWLRHLPSRET